jgi:hypothetical protein
VTSRIEGTFLVDGLIEGPLPDGPDAARKLEAWVSLMAPTGVRMSLEVDGSRFSLLPDPAAIPKALAGPTPSRTLRDNLQQLLDGLPPAHRAQVFSTLRSSDVGAGFEVQTAYAVGRDGRIETRDRTVDVETTRAPRRRPIGPMVIAALLGALLLAFLFLDSGRIFGRLFNLSPAAPSELAIDPGAFRPWITARVASIDAGNGTISIELARSADFPAGAAMDAALAKPGLPLDARLALNALATGYARCEMFDERGVFLEAPAIRLRGLSTSTSITVPVPFSRGLRPKRIELAP